MGEIKRPTPEELAAMTPKERREALRQRSQQDGQRWLKENCPNQESGPETFEDLIKKLEKTFGS